MTTSSQHPDYSKESSNFSIEPLSSSIDVSNLSMSTIDTITLSSSYTTSGNYINNIGSSGTISIGPISTSSISGISVQDFSQEYSISFPVEWENSFPEWSRIQKMCEQYPGLKIAFDKFKTTYNLVRDDFDTPPDKRIKP